VESEASSPLNWAIQRRRRCVVSHPRSETANYWLSSNRDERVDSCPVRKADHKRNVTPGFPNLLPATGYLRKLVNTCSLADCGLGSTAIRLGKLMRSQYTLWAVIVAALGGIDYAWAYLLGIKISLNSYVVLPAMALAGIYLILTLIKRLPRIAAFALAVAQFISMICVMVIL